MEIVEFAWVEVDYHSCAYGTVGAYVIGADAYEKMAYNRQIPSGAIIFQTRHGWTVSSSRQEMIWVLFEIAVTLLITNS